MSQTRRSVASRKAVARGARMLGGSIAAVLIVIGVVAVGQLPLPEVHTTAAERDITPPAGTATLVCAGPFRALAQDGAAGLQWQAAGVPERLTSSAGGTVSPLALATPELSGGQSVPGYIATPTSSGPLLLSAAQSLTLAGDDLGGFAASACRPPSLQSWLVGGTGEVGSFDVLTLANPGDVPATVTLTTYAGGQPTVDTVVVPARSQWATPLAASAVGQSAPVVHVQADGAPVRAALQSSLVRTLDPGGIEWQDDAGTPQTVQVLAGVQLVESAADVAPLRVRVMATGAATDAEFIVRGAGAEAVAAETVHLEAGVPTEVAFPTLSPGVYWIEVRAQEPVVAAAWQSTGTHAGSDFAWMTPTRELTDTVLFSVPTAPQAQLQLVNAGASEVAVTVTDLRDNSAREVTLAAGTSQLLPVSGGANYRVDTDGALRAALALGGADALAGWPLWPEAGLPVPLTIFG